MTNAPSVSPQTARAVLGEAAGDGVALRLGRVWQAAETDWGAWLGAVAVGLASINVFGGFLVTQRMLEMFKKKEKKGVAS